MITIQNLNKYYGKKQVIKNLDLSISKNQIHGLIGENGAGKSTFFECLTNLQSYTGIIDIPSGIQVGYMPTSLYYYPNMQGLEYIEFCLAARKQLMQKETVNKLNEIFELPLKEYANEYSTGMKKKLAIMTLFLQKNDFYILDEPFNGLDLSASLILKQLILILKERQKTVLISSHIISSLTDICDEIHFLNNGNIKQSYKPKDFDKIESDIISSEIKEKLSILNQCL